MAEEGRCAGRTWPAAARRVLMWRRAVRSHTGTPRTQLGDAHTNLVSRFGKPDPVCLLPESGDTDFPSWPWPWCRLRTRHTTGAL